MRLRAVRALWLTVCSAKHFAQALPRLDPGESEKLRVQFVRDLKAAIKVGSAGGADCGLPGRTTSRRSLPSTISQRGCPSCIRLPARQTRGKSVHTCPSLRAGKMYGGPILISRRRCAPASTLSRATASQRWRRSSKRCVCVARAQGTDAVPAPGYERRDARAHRGARATNTGEPGRDAGRTRAG